MSDYEKYKEMHGTMFDEQLALEVESKLEAEEMLKAVFEKTRTEGTAGSSLLGKNFSEFAWQDCRKNISVLVDSVNNGSKTVQGNYKPLLKQLIAIYAGDIDELKNIMCLITLSNSIGIALSTDRNVTDNSVSKLAGHIGNAILQEANVKRFIDYEITEKGKNPKWIGKNIDEAIAKRVQASYKIQYATRRMKEENYPILKWTAIEKRTLGIKLVEMVIKGSDFFEIVTLSNGSKSIDCIQMTDWFCKAWQMNENLMLSRICHRHPLIIPPKKWSSPFEGAYYGESAGDVSMIRVLDYGNNTSIKDYYKRLETLDMSFLYGVLNTMQETPFIINKKIMQIQKEIYARGGNMCGVPNTEPFQGLAPLPAGATEEEIKKHKQKASDLYKLEARRKSLCLRFQSTLQEAERFSKYDKIYFPWNMDFRGRCYPITHLLSPQGDDTQKSLLLFAEGTPLAGEEDLKWLYIHGANLAGHDKINFDERQAWVQEHISDILSSAKDPLGYLWWYEESKGDYPMEFLAFCFEIERLFEYKAQNNGVVKGFVSNLPIAFDGTCSGLQHFSALLRDEIGGHAVNLVPSDTVQDIYGMVAEKVNVKLLDDVTNGTEDETKTNKDGSESLKFGTQTLARQWVMFNRIKFGKDGITRKVCKRSVMTLAYGSKQYGFAENLQEDIIKPFIAEYGDNGKAIFLKPKQSAVYMAKLIWEAVKTTVVKAVEGMDYLQKMAKLITKGHHVVSWLSPNGLLIQQNYMAMLQEMVKVRFDGARVRIYAQQEQTGVIDKSKQASGIAPNFIHSLDASHLQRVVSAEASKGNKNFMMIHDSFGTDVAHAGSLFKTIRNEFVNMYKDKNILADFQSSVEYLIKDEDKEDIPAIPSFGQLDLEGVRQSDFCFA